VLPLSNKIENMEEIDQKKYNRLFILTVLLAVGLLFILFFAQKEIKTDKNIGKEIQQNNKRTTITPIRK